MRGVTPVAAIFIADCAPQGHGYCLKSLHKRERNEGAKKRVKQQALRGPLRLCCFAVQAFQTVSMSLRHDQQ